MIHELLPSVARRVRRGPQGAGAADPQRRHAGPTRSAPRSSPVRLLLMLVLLVPILLVGRSTVRPLRRIRRARTRSPAGNFAARTGVSGRSEVGELAVAFDTMAARVEQGRASLMSTAVLEASADLLLIVREGTVTYASGASTASCSGIPAVGDHRHPAGGAGARRGHRRAAGPGSRRRAESAVVQVRLQATAPAGSTRRWQWSTSVRTPRSAGLALSIRDVTERRAGRARPRGGARRCRGGVPPEVGVPGHDEPRDPHADERGDRPHRAAAHHRPRRAPGAVRRGRPERRRGPAGDHQRHPGLLEGRGRQAGARGDRLRPGRRWSRRPRSWSPTPPSEGPGAAGLLLARRCRPWVRGDPSGSARCCSTSSRNAVKFTAHGEVVVRGPRGAHDRRRLVVRFEVSDTGIGIPETEPATALRAVHAGRRLDDAALRRHRPRPGDLAPPGRRHGRRPSGSTARSAAGSTFWFTLPLRTAHDAATTRSVPSAGSTGPPGADRGRQRHQPPDPDRPARRLGHPDRRRRERREHALRALRRGRRRRGTLPTSPCWTSACRMMNGLELAGRISADRSLSAGTGLVLLTSAMDVTTDQPGQAGVTESLTKPVRLSQLHDRPCRTCMSHGPQGAAADPKDGARRLAGNRGHLLVVEDNPTNQLVAVRHPGQPGLHRGGGGQRSRGSPGPGPQGLRGSPDGLPHAGDGRVHRHQADPSGRGEARRTPIIAMTAGAVLGDRELCSGRHGRLRVQAGHARVDRHRPHPLAGAARALVRR